MYTHACAQRYKDARTCMRAHIIVCEGSLSYIHTALYRRHYLNQRKKPKSSKEDLKTKPDGLEIRRCSPKLFLSHRVNKIR